MNKDSTRLDRSVSGLTGREGNLRIPLMDSVRSAPTHDSRSTNEEVDELRCAGCVIIALAFSAGICAFPAAAARGRSQVADTPGSWKQGGLGESFPLLKWGPTCGQARGKVFSKYADMDFWSAYSRCVEVATAHSLRTAGGRRRLRLLAGFTGGRDKNTAATPWTYSSPAEQADQMKAVRGQKKAAVIDVVMPTSGAGKDEEAG